MLRAKLMSGDFREAFHAVLVFRIDFPAGPANFLLSDLAAIR
jgi:hypothetical protein